LQASPDGNLKRLLSRSQERQEQFAAETASAAEETEPFSFSKPSLSDTRASSTSATGKDSRSKSHAARKRDQQRTTWMVVGGAAGFFCLVAVIIGLSQSPEPSPRTREPYQAYPSGGWQRGQSIRTQRPGAMPKSRRQYLERGQQQPDDKGGEIP